MKVEQGKIATDSEILGLQLHFPLLNKLLMRSQLEKISPLSGQN
jgi:hypothetical protein